MKTNKTMTVELAHGRNPDIQGGGYWTLPLDSGKAHLVAVKDYSEASKVCMNFIERNGLGGGNWSGGKIRKDGKMIAHVSFNGRVWEGK